MSLLEKYGLDRIPDFTKLIDTSVSSFSFIPKTNTWDETHMLEAKMEGFDFASVCVRSFGDSRSSYELGLVKVVEWRVVDTFSSIFQPVVPLSKALRKRLPDILLEKIDRAPTLSSIWPNISNFFESNVLVGSNQSIRRLIYCLDACGLDISPVALPRENVNNELFAGEKSVIEEAIEWAAARINH